MTDEQEPQTELEPVKTVFVVCRDIPVTVKAKLVILKAERGWNSWADMIYDVVNEWYEEGKS